MFTKEGDHCPRQEFETAGFVCAMGAFLAFTALEGNPRQAATVAPWAATAAAALAAASLSPR